MVSIRAGLVCEILSNALSKVSIKEVIYYSGLNDQVHDFNLMKKTMVHLEKDDIFYGTETDLSTLFHSHEYIENYLINNSVKINGKIDSSDFTPAIKDIKAFPLRMLFAPTKQISYYPSEIKPNITKIESRIYDESEDPLRYIYQIKKKVPSELSNYISNRNIKMRKIYSAAVLAKVDPDPIDLSWKQYAKNSMGMRGENKALIKLRELGYVIEYVEGAARNMGDHIVNGKPDGFITSAPNPDHEGIYLEIKSKPFNRMRLNDFHQIYTYYYIFQSPILLVNYHNGLEFHLYTVKTLQVMWEEIEEKILINCSRLHQMINANTIEKFNVLEEKMKCDKISF